MTVKIFKSIFLTSLLVLLLSVSLAFGVSYVRYEKEVRSELEREGEYIAACYENYGDYLSGATSEIRITHINSDGAVIFDSHNSESTEERENHLEREEVKAALAEGKGEAVRYSSTLAETTVYYATLLTDGTVLRVSTARHSAIYMTLDFISPFILVLVLVMLVAFLAAKKLSAAIVRPINEIDLRYPEKNAIYDELKPVTKRLADQNYKIARQISELKMRANEFASITSNMNEGLVLINSKTVILFSNESANRFFGITTEGERSILSLDSTEPLRQAVRMALLGSNGYYELNKNERHYSIIVTPVKSDGITEGAVIVIIDDTEKEEREVLRREFTSNVSHELRTPLTSISGFAELIKNGIAEGEDAVRFAESIHKESKRLIDLVGDIIRLNQLDGGEIPYDGKISLPELCRDVYERILNIAEAASVELKLDLKEAFVLGNLRILGEIVYNLTDNAIKYNLAGGCVEISCYTSDDGAVLTVKDNGIGIPKEKQDRVFERFYRVDKSHSKEIGGTGLGLSIVKHAVSYHKAQITLDSEEGVGTEMKILFPKLENIDKDN